MEILAYLSENGYAHTSRTIQEVSGMLLIQGGTVKPITGPDLVNGPPVGTLPVLQYHLADRLFLILIDGLINERQPFLRMLV